jgi:zona occludens toxin
MINVLEGIISAGKSYDAVRIILSNLRKKSDGSIRHVLTNMDGMFDADCLAHIKFFTGLDDWEIAEHFHKLEHRDVPRFWKFCKPNYLVVIDETHKYFNSRDWKGEDNRACCDWASTSGHEGIDILLISQSIGKIDSQLRSLVEMTYRYRKINFFGSVINTLSLIFTGKKRDAYLVYAFDGEGGTSPMGTQKHFYDPRIFKCYKRYASKKIEEAGFMKGVNILRHPVFYAIPVVLGFTIYMFSKSSFSHGEIIPGMNAIKQKQAAFALASKNTPSSPVAVVQALPPKSGYIRRYSPRPLPAPVFDKKQPRIDPRGLIKGIGFTDGHYLLLVFDGDVLQSIELSRDTGARYRVGDIYPL